MNKINIAEINGEKVELIFNVMAMDKLGKKANTSNVALWISEVMTKEDNENKEDTKNKEFDISQLTYRICTALEVMANCAIIKKNMEIALGIQDGEKKQQYPDGYFSIVLDSVDAIGLVKTVLNTVAKGTMIEIPEALQLDIDQDYLDIESAKKN